MFSSPAINNTVAIESLSQLSLYGFPVGSSHERIDYFYVISLLSTNINNVLLARRILGTKTFINSAILSAFDINYLFLSSSSIFARCNLRSLLVSVGCVMVVFPFTFFDAR